MDRLRFPLIIIFLLFSLTAAACGSIQEDQVETPPPPAPTTSDSPTDTELPTPILAVGDTTGVIVGKLDNTTGPLTENVSIWTVRIMRSPEGYGIFALNTLTTPNFPVETSGEFQTEPIEAGEYVLIIGISPESASAILGEDGQAQPFEVLAGEVLDIGNPTIGIYLPPPLEDRPTPGYPPPQPSTTPSYP